MCRFYSFLVLFLAAFSLNLAPVYADGGDPSHGDNWIYIKLCENVNVPGNQVNVTKKMIFENGNFHQLPDEENTVSCTQTTRTCSMQYMRNYDSNIDWLAYSEYERCRVDSGFLGYYCGVASDGTLVPMVPERVGGGNGPDGSSPSE